MLSGLGLFSGWSPVHNANFQSMRTTPRGFTTLLDALSRFQVVPVVLGDSSETDAVTAFGIARLRDAESGRERTVVLTPVLEDCWPMRALTPVPTIAVMPASSCISSNNAWYMVIG